MKEQCRDATFVIQGSVCVCVVTGMQAKYQYIYKEVMCYRGLTGIQVKEQHTEK